MTKVTLRVGIVLIYLLQSSWAYAQVINPSGSRRPRTGGREYYVGLNLGRPLLTINLIGGVGLPGVYHVPVNTDMAELFSYAGGTLESANLEEVFVRSKIKTGEFKTKHFNFTKLVKSSQALPLVQNRDVIHIQTKDSLDSTLKWVSIASTVVSLVSAIIVIDQASK